MLELILKLKKALYEHSPNWEQVNTIIEEMTRLTKGKKPTPERLEMQRLTHGLRDLKGSLDRNASMLATDEVVREFFQNEEAELTIILQHNCYGSIKAIIGDIEVGQFDTETGDIHEVIRKAIIKSMQTEKK